MKNVFFEITKRRLLENKVRTIAILVGIIVSIAMITYVLFMSSSVHNFLIENAKNNTGDWSMAIKDPPADMMEKVKEDDLEAGKLKPIGYSLIKNSDNPQKPYIFIAELDKTTETMGNIDLVSGRMPTNSREIALPEHLSSNGGIDYKLGSIVKLNIGIREDKSNGLELSQNKPFENQEERFKSIGTHTFKVVGIVRRPTIEPYMSAGYTAITTGMNQYMTGEVAFFSDDDYSKLENYIEHYYTQAQRVNITYNQELLNVRGDVVGISALGPLAKLAIILTIIIVIGACILMYNTFNLSIEERWKQYEILATVGATGTQLRRAAIYEGIFFGILAIPTGILLGTLWVFMSVKSYGSVIASILVTDSNVPLEFNISLRAVIVVVVIAIFVVQISDLGPVYYAKKTKPIAAQKYVYDTGKIREYKIKFPNFVFKVAGVEGLLAVKNYNKNKRNFRLSMASLVMSMIITVTASALTTYAQNGIASVNGSSDGYDISYNNGTGEGTDKIYEILSTVDGVTSGTHILSAKLHMNISTTHIDYDVVILDDTAFERYLSKHIKEKQIPLYFDEKKPKAIGVSTVLSYNTSSGKMENKVLFGANETKPSVLKGVLGGENITFDIGNYVDTMPSGITNSIGNPTILMSETASRFIPDKVLKEGFLGEALFKTSDVTKTFNIMKKVCNKNDLSSNNLKNLQSSREQAEGILIFVKIFLFLFIILILVIAITNVMNTIIGTWDNRRYEFVTLLSIGMTPRSLRKMVKLECIIFGTQIIIAGLILSGIGLFLLYKSMTIGALTGYVIPIGSILLSIISVMIVVKAIMSYSSYKIGYKDAVEILKNKYL